STNYDDELQERIIEAPDCFDCPKPDSLVSENDLNLVRPAQDEGDVERDQRDHGRHAVRQDVAPQNLARTEAFGPSRGHEIFRHDADQGIPHDEGDSREGPQRERECWEQEMEERIPHVDDIPVPGDETVIVISGRRESGPPGNPSLEHTVLPEGTLLD